MSLLLLLNNNDDGSPDAIDNNISLYIISYLEQTGDTTLFINGIPPELSTTLATTGHEVSNNAITLYEFGIGVQTNNTTLFINGVPVDKYATLYIGGYMTSNKGLNLVTVGPDAPSSADNTTTLYIEGTNPGVQGLFATIPLFLDSSHAIGSLNLSLFCDLPGTLAKGMNLFTKGYFLSASNTITLSLFNDTPSKTTTLFIKGEGTTPGALPANGSMNLFIKRGIGDAISLFLNATPPTTNTAPLYTMGAFLLNNSIPLAMSKVTGQEIKSVKLYTHGF